MKHKFRITREITFSSTKQKREVTMDFLPPHITPGSPTPLTQVQHSCMHLVLTGPCCCVFLFFLNHHLHHPHPPHLTPPHSASVSPFPSGMDRGTPADLDRSSDRRVPVNKPRFPQYRNRSLDCPAGTRCMYLFHLPCTCKATPHSPHSILQHAFCRSV